MKSTVLDSFHTVRDCDRSERTAVSERIVLNSFHTVRDCDRSERSAVSERIVLNSFHTVRNCDRSERSTVAKRHPFQSGHRIWKVYPFQLFHVVEDGIRNHLHPHFDLDVGDVAWYFVPQLSSPNKRLVFFNIVRHGLLMCGCLVPWRNNDVLSRWSS